MHERQKVGHEMWHVFHIAILLFHVERLAKAKIAEDVKDQVVEPVGHVQRL